MLILKINKYQNIKAKNNKYQNIKAKKKKKMKWVGGESYNQITNVAFQTQVLRKQFITYKNYI